MEKEVVIVGSSSKKVTNYLNKLDKAGEIELMLIPDTITNEFVKNGSEHVDTVKKLADFLKEEQTRVQAFNKATNLAAILCKNYRIKNENLQGIPLTTKHIVKCTDLSHNQAKELLNLLSIFGYIVFFNNHTFTFNLELEDITPHFESDIRSSIVSVLQNIVKLQSFVENKEITIDPKLEELENCLKAYLIPAE